MSEPTRKIIHCDCDCFYAAVEMRDDPRLRGRPLAVGGRAETRGVIATCNYEARAFGVHSAMPTARALQLCPQLILLPPDFNRYREASRAILAIYRDYTALVEPLSLDEAYLDVTQNKLGLASATAVAESVRAQIREETALTASAGVAPNKFLAKIASDWRKPDGIYVVKPAMVADFLAPLPVGKIPGVGKVMEGRLAALGIRSVGQLRGFGADALEARFGRWGRRLHELSLGIDEHPVQSERPTTQVSAEDTFDTDLPLEATGDAIVRLAAKAWAAARRETERSPRTIVLKLKTADFRILTRSLTPTVMPDTLEAFTALALELRQRVDLPARTRYRLVGVGLANFRGHDDAPPQPGLFDRDEDDDA